MCAALESGACHREEWGRVSSGSWAEGGSLQWGVQGTGSLKGPWSLSSSPGKSSLHLFSGGWEQLHFSREGRKDSRSRAPLGSYLTNEDTGGVSNMDKGPQKARGARKSQAGAEQLHLSHNVLIPDVKVPGRREGHRCAADISFISEPACPPALSSLLAQICLSLVVLFEAHTLPWLFSSKSSLCWSPPPLKTGCAWVTLFSTGLLFKMPDREDDYSELSHVQ